MALKDKIQLAEYKMITEPRGWFQKPLTGHDDVPDQFGEIYAVQAHPGEVRGNHYHERASEWFFVVEGTARAYLVDVDSKELMTVELSADDPKRLLIRPRAGHAFVNEGNRPFILIAYTDVVFDPTDTIAMDIHSGAPVDD